MVQPGDTSLCPGSAAGSGRADVIHSRRFICPRFTRWDASRIPEGCLPTSKEVGLSKSPAKLLIPYFVVTYGVWNGRLYLFQELGVISESKNLVFNVQE